MPMSQNSFFKDPKLPYVELRYTRYSRAHYRPHLHPTLSIGAIEKGKVSFTALDRNSLLHPGELIFINPEILHACNPIEGEARSYYMLYLDSNWSHALEETLFGTLDAFVPLSQVLVRDSLLYEAFIALSSKLLDTKVLLLEKEAALEEFMLKIFGKYCNKDICAHKVKGSQKNVHKIKQYLGQHFRNNPSTEEIAQAVGVSRYHLIRTFKKSTKATPHTYLLNLKIQYAKKLLAANTPIAEIALESGFGDQSHLNRVFKQITACTPHEYRQGLLSSSAE